MVETIWDQVRELMGLGLDIGDVGALQMALRAVVIYTFTLVAVRLGSKRFLGQATAFDVIIGIMLGSVMSRAINGSAPVFPTLVAGVVLLVMHWILASLTFRLRWFGAHVKGEAVRLIRDGHVEPNGVRRGTITQQDIEEALRLEGMTPEVSRVKLAYLERNGQISVIPAQKEPRVLDVSVQDGVQTVRIQLE